MKIEGSEAKDFLQRLLTNNIQKLEQGACSYGALLTPQGKVLSDMFVFALEPNVYALDVPISKKDELFKRLSMYKLKSDVTISHTDIQTFWAPSTTAQKTLIQTPDPRHTNMGSRGLLLPSAQSYETLAPLYLDMRIRACIPEGNIDFDYNDIFAHEMNLDLMHGVDFKKGCYVGQEVVSRVHHRGSDRKRFIMLSIQQGTPKIGEDVCLNGQKIGIMGSSSMHLHLALAQVRTDKIPLDQGLINLQSDNSILQFQP